MSDSDDNKTSNCTACGTFGDGLKVCTACKLVKYCNETCQRAHWPKHKKECKKRAAELKDEALFKELSMDECPICMLPLPLNNLREMKYQPCCGKLLCAGCVYAAQMADNRKLCPFCRAPEHTSQSELIERLKKRVEVDDAEAIHQLGRYYYDGVRGFPQDYDKAMELWLRAGELGCATAYQNLADDYYHGRGVERDEKKAKYYYELAAMGGNLKARHRLACMEMHVGNTDQGVKHFMIAAGAGYDDSLDYVRRSFMLRVATKDDFEKALRAHKEANDEMKSDQRDAAVSARDTGSF